MALAAANVRVAVSGAVYTAPLGTTAPTTSIAAWAAGWVDLGYLSDDGFTEADDVNTEEINAWQNGALVRRIVTGSAKTFEFTCIESKKAVVELRHPGSTVTSGSVNVKSPVSGLTKAFGFDVLDGSTHLRIIVPNAEVTDVADIEYAAGSAIGYGVTITAYPDANGTVVVKLSDDASWA